MKRLILKQAKNITFKCLKTVLRKISGAKKHEERGKLKLISRFIRDTYFVTVMKCRVPRWAGHVAGPRVKVSSGSCEDNINIAFLS